MAFLPISQFWLLHLVHAWDQDPVVSRASGEGGGGDCIWERNALKTFAIGSVSVLLI